MVIRNIYTRDHVTLEPTTCKHACFATGCDIDDDDVDDGWGDSTTGVAEAGARGVDQVHGVTPKWRWRPRGVESFK